MKVGRLKLRRTRPRGSDWHSGTVKRNLIHRANKTTKGAEPEAAVNKKTPRRLRLAFAVDGLGSVQRSAPAGTYFWIVTQGGAKAPGDFQTEFHTRSSNEITVSTDADKKSANYR